MRRLATETKQAFKTSEFWAFVVVAIGLLIAGAVVGENDDTGDFFKADKIWLYLVILTVGYMISRGLAKCGSRDPYWDQPGSDTDEGLGQRVKAAAQVLSEGQQAGGQSGAGQQGQQGQHPRA